MEIAQHGARCLVTIFSPEGEDSGIYTCFAYNDSGHVSCQSQLTVEEGETTARTDSLLSFCHLAENMGGQVWSVIVLSPQVHWNFRREKWSWGREESYSLCMMFTRKWEGETVNYTDVDAQAL